METNHYFTNIFSWYFHKVADPYMSVSTNNIFLIFIVCLAVVSLILRSHEKIEVILWAFTATVIITALPIFLPTATLLMLILF